jgi:hypothetical protein
MRNALQLYPLGPQDYHVLHVSDSSTFMAAATFPPHLISASAPYAPDSCIIKLNIHVTYYTWSYAGA